MSHEEVDASNSPTESFISFKDSELGLELIYVSSNKAISLRPISSLTTLPSTNVVISESVVSFSS